MLLCRLIVTVMMCVHGVGVGHCSLFLLHYVISSMFSHVEQVQSLKISITSTLFKRNQIACLVEKKWLISFLSFNPSELSTSLFASSTSTSTSILASESPSASAFASKSASKSVSVETISPFTPQTVDSSSSISPSYKSPYNARSTSVISDFPRILDNSKLLSLPATNRFCQPKSHLTINSEFLIVSLKDFRSLVNL